MEFTNQPERRKEKMGAPRRMFKAEKEPDREGSLGNRREDRPCEAQGWGESCSEKKTP